MSGKPGVMIYFETGRAIKNLDNESKGILFDAILEYAEFASVPTFDNVILNALWPFISQKIDNDTERYQVIVNKRQRAVYIRWWNEYARKNGIDAENIALREEWITMQMNTSDTNVFDAIQTLPTTTAPSSTTAPSTGTTAPSSYADSSTVYKG